MMLLLMYCAATSSTGRSRYLLASSHTIGGAPLTSGHSHSVPRTSIEVGPARLGIQ